jgi:hypothetical protein
VFMIGFFVGCVGSQSNSIGRICAVCAGIPELHPPRTGGGGIERIGGFGDGVAMQKQVVGRYAPQFHPCKGGNGGASQTLGRNVTETKIEVPA